MIPVFSKFFNFVYKCYDRLTNFKSIQNWTITIYLCGLLWKLKFCLPIKKIPQTSVYTNLIEKYFF